MSDFAQPGEQVRFIDANGWAAQLERAREQFTKGQILTVESVDIGGWSSTYKFENVLHGWNTVMFEKVAEEAPVAESQPVEPAKMPTKDEMIDLAIATLKKSLDVPYMAYEKDEPFRAAMADVIAEVRKKTLDTLLLDADAVDGARHLLLWMDGHTRPTERNLLTHCKLLGKTAPEEARDIDRVPPKSLRTYWILKAVVDEHRRLCAAK